VKDIAPEFTEVQMYHFESYSSNHPKKICFAGQLPGMELEKQFTVQTPNRLMCQKIINMLLI